MIKWITMLLLGIIPLFPQSDFNLEDLTPNSESYGNISAGIHEFQWDESHQPSGIYFIHFHSKNWIKTQKAILVK
ncbi:MAG: hypothetical protein ACKVH5_03880 [Fidelibacterota bacterium]|jgi:hypothetical protein